MLVKKISILLCGIVLCCFLTGCGSTMPELTEEENDLITEYAVSLLLKYDKNSTSRLIDLAAYEEERSIIEDNAEAVKEAESLEEEETDSPLTVDTEVVDLTDESEASTIEEFYGIDGFSFQYMGYDFETEYPEMADNEADAFFAMEATQGMQLMVLKFHVINQYGAELNMSSYNTKMRVSINGESSKSVLFPTMLLNDIQAYKGVPEADGSTELVAIVEVPEGTSVDTLSLILRNDSDNATITLQ